MNLETIIILIALAFTIYGLGYVVGFRHCFHYIEDQMESIRDHTKEKLHE